MRQLRSTKSAPAYAAKLRISAIRQFNTQAKASATGRVWLAYARNAVARRRLLTACGRL